MVVVRQPGITQNTEVSQSTIATINIKTNSLKFGENSNFDVNNIRVFGERDVHARK